MFKRFAKINIWGREIKMFWTYSLMVANEYKVSSGPCIQWTVTVIQCWWARWNNSCSRCVKSKDIWWSKPCQRFRGERWGMEKGWFKHNGCDQRTMLYTSETKPLVSVPSAFLSFGSSLCKKQKIMWTIEAHAKNVVCSSFARKMNPESKRTSSLIKSKVITLGLFTEKCRGTK